MQGTLLAVIWDLDRLADLMFVLKKYVYKKFINWNMLENIRLKAANQVFI